MIFSRLVFKFCYVWSRVAVTLLLRHDTSGIALNGLVFNEYSPLLLWGAQNIFQPWMGSGNCLANSYLTALLLWPCGALPKCVWISNQSKPWGDFSSDFWKFLCIAPTSLVLCTINSTYLNFPKDLYLSPQLNESPSFYLHSFPYAKVCKFSACRRPGQLQGEGSPYLFSFSQRL